jgi:DNA-directed RNA polymerase specialized sigma24 family protein
MSGFWSELVSGTRSPAVRLFGLGSVVVLLLIPMAAALADGLVSERLALPLTAALTVPLLIGSMASALAVQRRRQDAGRRAAAAHLADAESFLAGLGIGEEERAALLDETLIAWPPGDSRRPASLEGRLLAAVGLSVRDRWLRRAAAMLAEEEAAVPPAPGSRPVSSADLAVLDRALESMPALAKDCLWLRYGRGFSEAQVATLLRLRVDQVAERLAEALRMVPQSLLPDGLS